MATIQIKLTEEILAMLDTLVENQQDLLNSLNLKLLDDKPVNRDEVIEMLIKEEMNKLFRGSYPMVDLISEEDLPD